ncbi:MAG: RCC1 domain-containing protein, partial [Actinomycetota bacterium]
ANQPIITTGTLPTLNVFEVYDEALEVAGGTPPYLWGAAGLAPGLEIDGETGRVGNDPSDPAVTDASDTSVTVTVTDAEGRVDNVILSLEVVGAADIGVGRDGDTRGTHSCALDTDGAAWCWGRNALGELGNPAPGVGGDNHSETPVPVQGGHTFASIDAGAFVSCGLDTDGSAWCWGGNGNGQLGDGNLGTERHTPVEVAGDHDFAALSVGPSHSCAVDTEGAAWCWGWNPSGQIGDGTDGNERDTPTPVSGGHTFRSVDPGGFHSCGIDGEGAAWCWGDNSVGQLGNPGAGAGSPVPVAVADDHTFVTITAGEAHTCAIDIDDDTWCWGWNDHGQVGDGTEGVDRPAPELVEGDHTLGDVVAGEDHTCAVDDTAGGWCWGSNGFGQFGNGTEDGSTVPVPIDTSQMGEIRTLATEDFHTCGIDGTDTVWCWGVDAAGALGNTTAPLRAPVPHPVHPGS